MSRTAIYPGTFDPVTRGHIDIIERASKMVDKLYVGILNNPKKNCLFSVEERLTMLKVCLRHIPNIEVIYFDGLLIDYALDNNIDFIIRGLRAVTDFEYELQLAQTNRELSEGAVDTLFLTSSAESSFLSSSAVRDIARFSSNPEYLDKFVTLTVRNAVLDKMSKFEGA